MKKILAFSLALLMVFALAACGGKTDPAPSGSGTTDPDAQQTGQPSNTTDPDADKPDDTTATEQGVTVTIEKPNYQPGEKIYFAWSGVTDAHAAGVLWGAIRLCAAGSEYGDWIDDKMIDCEAADLDVASHNYFTAPATAGAYEIRFYWYEQEVGYEENFVLSVPFTVE